MAWREIQMRGGDHTELMHKLKAVKEMLCEICEDVAEMDEMSERSGMGERGGFDDMAERRGVRGTGRYSRF